MHAVNFLGYVQIFRSHYPAKINNMEMCPTFQTLAHSENTHVELFEQRKVNNKRGQLFRLEKASFIAF